MSWPNSEWAGSPAWSGTLTLLVSRREKPSVMPASAKFVARVTMNEGTRVRVTTLPLMKPTSMPNAKASRMPTNTGAPK